MKNIDWSKIMPLVYQILMIILGGAFAVQDHQTTQAVMAFGADPGTTIAGASVTGAIAGLYAVLHALVLAFGMGKQALNSAIKSAAAQALAEHEEKTAG